MSESSYSGDMAKHNAFLSQLPALLLGALIMTIGWFAQSWLSGRIEMVTIQASMTTLGSTVDRMADDVSRFNELFDMIKQNMEMVPKINDRVTVLEESKKHLEGQLNHVKDQIKFYHGPGDDKDRRTIEEWKQEFERRQNEKKKKGKGNYEDSWDSGIYRENQNW